MLSSVDWSWATVASTSSMMASTSSRVSVHTPSKASKSVPVQPSDSSVRPDRMRSDQSASFPATSSVQAVRSRAMECSSACSGRTAATADRKSSSVG